MGGEVVSSMSGFHDGTLVPGCLIRGSDAVIFLFCSSFIAMVDRSAAAVV